ncbi:MAG: GIY-YIG nuclease family protein [Paraclostridium sp.]
MKIYKITNTINSIIYVGCTRLDLNKRLSQHFCHSRTVKKQEIHKAMATIGCEFFNIELLAEVDDVKAAETENYYIEKFSKESFSLYNKTLKSNIKKEFYSYCLKTNKKEKHFLIDTKKYNAARVSEMLNEKENVVNGKKYNRFSYKEKLWSYVNDDDNWNKLFNLNKNKKEMCKTRQIRAIESGIVFESQRKANAYFGSNPKSSRIGNAIKKGYKTHGFHWEYV